MKIISRSTIKARFIRVAIRFVLLLFCLLVFHFSYSLPSAQFTSDVSSGCPPLIVHFTNTSTGATNYVWDFGNGNLSISVNSQTSYSATGTYNVTLTAYNGSNSSTYSMQIIVFPKPMVSFSTGNNVVCTGTDVVFTNSTVPGIPGNSPIVSCLWDFGDGHTSTLTTNTVSHSYSLSGIYDITLMATDQNGCSDLLTQINYIHVESPDISFLSPNTYFCSPPDTVSFINLTQGAAPFTYLWHFGDGSVSTAENPQHVYTNFGQYSVELDVTDWLGCSKTYLMVNYINIVPVAAGFSVVDTVCSGTSVNIINLSTGASHYTWNIGGIVSNDYEFPGYIINQSGNVNISLIADMNGSCPDTVSKSVFVISVAADFSPDPSCLCEVPYDVQYLNFSTTNDPFGLSDYQWNFGNGQSSDLFSPVVHFIPDTVLKHHHQESFSDELIITSHSGCSSMISQINDVNIILPVVKCKHHPKGGCVPVTIDFAGISGYNSSCDSIVTWSWDFDDGNTGTGQYITHTYQDTGVFYVKLTAITGNGCDTVWIDTIWAGNHQHPDFTWVPHDTICGSAGIHLHSTSYDADYIDLYEWFFLTDGILVLTFSPDLTYYPAYPGWLNTVLVVVDKLCPTSIFKYHMDYVLPPITHVVLSHACQEHFLYYFVGDDNYNPMFIGMDHFYWDFGDGSPVDSVSHCTSHLYSQTGNYTVTLYSVNDSAACTYISTLLVHVKDPKAEFSANPINACLNSSVSFQAVECADCDTFTYDRINGKFRWNFDDNSIFGNDTIGYTHDTITTFPEINHVFYSTGIHHVRLIVRDSIACEDTAYVPVHIYFPDAVLTAQPSGGCVPLTVQFSSETTHDTTITSWVWFYDSTLDTSGTGPHPVYTYTSPGSYSVTLLITDTLGCSNYITVPDMVSAGDVTADFAVDSGYFCINSIIKFKSGYTGNNVNYHWDFGNGDVIETSCDSVYYIYHNGGNYTMTLIITSFDCSGSKSINFEIQDPTVEINISANNQVCYPSVLSPGYSPDQPYITSWFWTFGDGVQSVLKAPEHIYPYPGTYFIGLTVYTTNQCSAYVYDTLQVINLNAGMNISDHDICLGDSVLFSLNNTLNVWGFLIDYGDGTPFGAHAPVYHVYNNSAPGINAIYPTLIYWSSDSVCIKTEPAIINVYDTRALFSRGEDGLDADTAGCPPLNVYFLNQSVGADGFLWQISNGNTFTSDDISFTFTQSGIYWVTLTATGTDCSVKQVKKIHIFDLPDLQITAKTSICLGDTLKLHATGGATYQWSPAELLNDPVSPDPVSVPQTSTTYYVTAKINYGCEKTGSIPVYVQHPPVINIADTSIVIGSQINLNGLPQYMVQYYWTPSAGLSCCNCYNPVFSPLQNTTYFLTMTAYIDDSICFTATDSVYIQVLDEYSLDMPDVFTPNNDGVNDVLLVRGWGLKSLIEFKVFNRWGQLIFKTDDLQIGWDGFFNGKPQNSDTYVYLVKALTYSGHVLEKSGNVTLLR
ncbi:MAG: PKD domain-containing protein [Bacteroidia bacterium]|nr:PKD domain-containing protein [Bacteroidia bacterium]